MPFGTMPYRPARRRPLAVAAALTALSMLAAAPRLGPDDEREAIAATVAALYAVISGPAGEPRDWDAFRALCAPNARLTAMVREVDTGAPRVFDMTADEYIERNGEALVERGFTEREIASRTETFGAMAQVWSTYEAFVDGGEAPFVRGINSIQLVKLDGQWKVWSVLWDSEREGQPIPPEYQSR